MEFCVCRRVSKALGAIPKQVNAVFDIGCDDGYLLRHLASSDIDLDGCDPQLAIAPLSNRSKLLKGYFPDVLKGQPLSPRYDAIFAVAVFEHLTEQDLEDSADVIVQMLSEGGRLIITVPHPAVDHILRVLLALKLVEAKTLDEHHGFDPNDLRRVFAGHLRLVRHTRFQLGLNNLFVFEKRSDGAPIGE